MGSPSAKMTLELWLFDKPPVLFRFMDMVALRNDMAEMFRMVATFTFMVFCGVLFAHNFPRLLDITKPSFN